MNIIRENKVNFVLYFIAIISVWNFSEVVAKNTEWDTEYDYVVVGGGVAGSIIATRLSEDKDVSVLLLEAGVEATDPFIRVPLTFSSVTRNPDLDWGIKTEPQSYSPDKKRVPMLLGKLLGGSGSHNTQLYLRGSRYDYDRWAEMGNYNWSYEAVLPYFKKFENMQETDIRANGFHGTDGPVEIHWFENASLIDEFITASTHLGFKFNEDINGPIITGVGRGQVMFSSNGERASSYNTYLKPKQGRWNLHILTRAQATKLTFTSQEDKPRVEGVYFIKDDRNTHFVKVKREIIVTAGSIGSPTLLLRSGIGPRKHLSSVGLPTISNLPVGKNLQDHVGVYIPIKFNKAASLETKKYYTFEALFNYIFTGKGIWSGLRTSVIFSKSEIQPIEDLYPYLENLIYIGEVVLPPEIEGLVREGRSISQEILENLMESEEIALASLIIALHSKSTGQVTLRSQRPQDLPIVNFDFLSHPDDVQYLVEGIRTHQKLMETDHLQKLHFEKLQLSHPNCDNYNMDSDDFLECYIYNTFLEISHPTSSCKMAPDSTGVVDDRLRVKGVTGLRVADASIMPQIISGHTAAPTMMIAEKASDMIKTDALEIRVRPSKGNKKKCSKTPKG